MEYRKCLLCEQEKPLNSGYFKEVAGGVFRHICLDCQDLTKKDMTSNRLRARTWSKGLLRCGGCDQYLDTSCFYKDKSKSGRGGYGSNCILCNKSYYKENQQHLTEDARMRLHNRFLKDPLGTLLIKRHTVCKSTARKRNLDFDLMPEDIVCLYEKQKGICALSGIKMTYISGEGRILTNISVDRIDSSSGYLKDNIQLVCDIINTMKTDLDTVDFLNFCNKIVDYNNT